MLKNKTTFKFALLIFFLLSLKSSWCLEQQSVLFWPPQPAEVRISFVRALYTPSGLKPRYGFLKKVKNIIFGEEVDTLTRPSAIAVDKEKNLYICDTGGRAVFILFQKGGGYKKITSLDNQGLLSPVGVAVSSTGSLYISDSKLRKVFCLDKSGKLKFIIGDKMMFLRPTGLAVTKDKLYVADTLANTVLVFDLKGTFISRFGRKGSATGEFNYPTAIAADSSGKIYVVDAMNFRIQVFGPDYRYLYSIGSLGDSSGSFSRPKGVAIDSFGHIYSTDGIFDNVQIFGKSGEFLLFFGQQGNKEGEFWIPSGMAIDEEDYIYIADSYNQRIQIFRYLGKD